MDFMHILQQRACKLCILYHCHKDKTTSIFSVTIFYLFTILFNGIAFFVPSISWHFYD